MSLLKILEVTAGFILLGIGVIGLLVPVMPQWPFIIPGLALLSRHYHWANRLTKWAQEKMEQARQKMSRNAGPKEP